MNEQVNAAVRPALAIILDHDPPTLRDACSRWDPMTIGADTPIVYGLTYNPNGKPSLISEACICVDSNEAILAADTLARAVETDRVQAYSIILANATREGDNIVVSNHHPYAEKPEGWVIDAPDAIAAHMEACLDALHDHYQETE